MAFLPLSSQFLQSPAKIPIFFSPPILRLPSLILHPSPVSLTILLCSIPKFRATSNKYVYPDPIPEFARSETLKFRAELLKKLSLEKQTFGDDLVRVVDVCAEGSTSGDAWNNRLLLFFCTPVHRE